MRACMDENGMKFDEGEVDELTRALFHDATVVTTTGSSSTSSQAKVSWNPALGSLLICSISFSKSGPDKQI